MQFRRRVCSFDAIPTGKFVVDESGSGADRFFRHRNGGTLAAQPMCAFHFVHLLSKREHDKCLSVTGCLQKDQVMI